MRGSAVFFLMMAVIFAWSCEDPNTLSVSRVFSSNNLQTVFSDTFSVVTSTVQLDTFLTANTGTILLGNYQDDRLGKVSAASYIQLSPSPTGIFKPDIRSYFDSAVLVLNYNHIFSGDTTKRMKINGYQLTEPMLIRFQPTGSIKLSAFNFGNGFFSSSSFSHSPTPLFSGAIKLFPHTDSTSIRLPDALGSNWLKLASVDSIPHYFSISSNFVNSFFYGLYLEADPSIESSVVGFDAKKFKIRIYYKRFVGDLLKQTFADFKILSLPQLQNFQFNNIKTDRSGIPQLSVLKPREQVSSLHTGNVSFVQGGTGLATRLDFPSLKSFFANQQNLVLNAVNLIIQPERGTFPKNFLPPSQIQLYTTDQTNIPLSIVNGASAGISYDNEYGINTKYIFQLFPYIFGQIKSGTNSISPLLLVGSANQGSNVQRLYISDRFHPNTKIQLQILYSYAQN